LERGLTPTGLAGLADCSTATIHNLERGKNLPGLELSRRLAAALQTTVDEIFPPAEELVGRGRVA